MNNVKIFVSVIVILVVGVIATAFLRDTSTPAGPGKLDSFAQCINDSGAVFYGAFWCSHCQAQKKLFGSSAKLLPYVECSTPDGRGQLQVCRDKKVEGYPTWRFADGTELNGEVPLLELAKKTSCVLPE
ncbi:MAG: hypothetical protein WC783_05770 [Candidatus Paceibacterota bacterium]|jgi:hypothetical protein